MQGFLLTLERLADQSRRDTNLTKFAREEYRKLIDRFPEDGFEIGLPDSIDIGQENVLGYWNNTVKVISNNPLVSGQDCKRYHICCHINPFHPFFVSSDITIQLF